MTENIEWDWSLKQKKAWALEKGGQTMMTTTSRIRPETKNKLLQLIEILSIIHPRRAPSSLSAPWRSWWLFHEAKQSSIWNAFPVPCTVIWYLWVPNSVQTYREFCAYFRRIQYLLSQLTVTLLCIQPAELCAPLQELCATHRMKLQNSVGWPTLVFMMTHISLYNDLKAKRPMNRPFSTHYYYYCAYKQGYV
jgi:hypothetical protein